MVIHIKDIERQRGLTTRVDRICKFCLNDENINVVEDECHFLLHCPLYSDIRSTYLNDFLHNIVIGTNTFKSIIYYDDAEKLSKLSAYISHAFALHSRYNNL